MASVMANVRVLVTCVIMVNGKVACGECQCDLRGMACTVANVNVFCGYGE